MYKSMHDNWVNIDGSESKWKTWNEIKDKSLGAVKLLQDYVDRSSRSKCRFWEGFATAVAEVV